MRRQTGRVQKAAKASLGVLWSSMSQMEVVARAAQDPLAMTRSESESNGDVMELKPMEMKKTEAKSADRKFGWKIVKEQISGMAIRVVISMNGQKNERPELMKKEICWRRLP